MPSATGAQRPVTALSDAGPAVPALLVEGIDAIRLEMEQAHPIWIDIEDPTPEQIEQIQSLFSFHPLALEDVHHAIQRPKLDEYDEHLFLVAFWIRPGEDTRFSEVEVDVFIGPGYLVTFHEEPVPVIAEIAERCKRGRVPMERGPDHLLYAILDGLVDACFPLLDVFDERMEGIEQRLLGKPDSRLLSEIFATRRSLLDLRRLLIPHRELLGYLSNREYPWVSAPVRTYFRDVFDHLMRITEAADRLRELLDTSVELHLSQQAQSTNQVMKVLAIVATLGLPLTVVTSFYGMNFEHMPGLRHPAAVPILVAGLLAVEAALLWLFRKKEWL